MSDKTSPDLRPNDKFFIMASQHPDQGRTWSFVAGPYDSEAMAKGNQDHAMREYAARNHQPAWLEGATVRVVHSDMPLPTALGPIQAPEQSAAAIAMPDKPLDFRADVFDGLMTRLEAFGDEFERLATTAEQKALAEAFGELISDADSSIRHIAEATRQHGPVPHPEGKRFEFTHEPEENADRAYVLIDGKFDVAIIRTDEGVVVDVYNPSDATEPVATTYAFDSEVDNELFPSPASNAAAPELSETPGTIERAAMTAHPTAGAIAMSDNRESPLADVERQVQEVKGATINSRGEIVGPWRELDEAARLEELEGEVNWSVISDKQKEALLAREVDFSKISRDQLNAVYVDIGSDDIDERPARRLFDEANYARAVAEAGQTPFADQLAQARDTTRNLVESVMQDGWPRAGAIVDFGIDSQRHYEALYYPIRNGEIAPSVLDAAMGHGAKLTELMRAAPGNPHKDIQFHTSWDELLGRSAEAEDPGRTPGSDDCASRKPTTITDSSHRGQFQRRDDARNLDR